MSVEEKTLSGEKWEPCFSVRRARRTSGRMDEHGGGAMRSTQAAVCVCVCCPGHAPNIIHAHSIPLHTKLRVHTGNLKPRKVDEGSKELAFLREVRV
jgi:hypothetical protein